MYVLFLGSAYADLFTPYAGYVDDIYAIYRPRKPVVEARLNAGLDDLTKATHHRGFSRRNGIDTSQGIADADQRYGAQQQRAWSQVGKRHFEVSQGETSAFGK
ncbi:hypothetical protein GCM10023067_60100 [Aminobacter aganoensis]